MALRVFAGVMCLFISALLIAFLADANWAALGDHPGRIVTTVVLMLVAGILITSGIRLLRARKGS